MPQARWRFTPGQPAGAAHAKQRLSLGSGGLPHAKQRFILGTPPMPISALSFNISAPGALHARQTLRPGCPRPTGGIHINPGPRCAGAKIPKVYPLIWLLAIFLRLQYLRTGGFASPAGTPDWVPWTYRRHPYRSRTPIRRNLRGRTPSRGHPS